MMKFLSIDIQFKSGITLLTRRIFLSRLQMLEAPSGGEVMKLYTRDLN